MRVLMFEPTGGYWPYTHELAEALGSFTQVDLLTSQKHSGVYSYGMHALLRPMAAHLRAPGNPLFGVAWACEPGRAGYLYGESPERGLATDLP